MTNNLFEALGLKKSVLKAIKNLGYRAPTPVQAEFIPAALTGKDALASAETGSGKTSAYTIPVLNFLLDHTEKSALFVAPTRELAQQIQSVFRALTKDTDINTALITGGKNMQGQLRKLKNNPRVVIGTPGRLNDHLKRKSLKLDSTAIVVWDETDRMLDLGFAAQIEEIISFLPPRKQTLMLSATFPPRVLKIARKYLNDPQKVIIGQLNNPSDKVTQRNIKIEGNEKLKKLTSILSEAQGQVLIFVRTQRAAAEIAKYLQKNSFSAAALHGGLRQKERDSALKAFREQKIKILTATDVAARGLDIPSISTVINYELPQNPEEYIHRLGRTGRYDKTGLCLNLIARADRAQWKNIRAFMDKKHNLSQEHENSSKESGPAAAPEPEKTRRAAINPPNEQKRKNGAPAEKESQRLKTSSSDYEFPKRRASVKAERLDGAPAKKETAAEKTTKEYSFTPFKKVYVGKIKKDKSPKEKTIQRTRKNTRPPRKKRKR